MAPRLKHKDLDDGIGHDPTVGKNQAGPTGRGGKKHGAYILDNLPRMDMIRPSLIDHHVVEQAWYTYFDILSCSKHEILFA